MARLTVVLAAAVIAAACSQPASSTITTAQTTTTTSTTAAARRPPFCDVQWEGREAGRVSADELTEISGAVVSRSHPGIIWTHNDSGSDAVMFALGLDGSLQGRVELPELPARDWEDMAIGPGPAPGDYLYLADIGDNSGVRESVRIHRIPEPAPDSERANGGETLTITYPNGPTEAETLLVDAVSGEIVILGKALSGRTPVFTIPPGAPWGGSVESTPAGDVALGAFALATGGDATERRVVVRTYDEAFVWERRPGETLAESISRPGCRLASIADRQGEAIALSPGSDRFFALSEGTDQPLLVFEPPP